MEVKSYGFIAPTIETHEQGIDHVLGATGLPGEVINPTGDWLPYLPDREPQSKNGVETQACTVYGTLSALETLVFFKTGVKVNYSDRYVANVAKNRGILNPYGGADPHKIAELIRTITGNLREEKCPWTNDVNTVDEYYGIVGQELANLMFEGTDWYKEWELKHAWVWTGKPTPEQKKALLKEARLKGVPCVSVSAWHKQDGVYFKPEGATDNHWTMAPKDEKVFDSYDTYVKDVEPLYDYGFAKVYYLIPVKPKPHVFTKNLGFQMMDEEVTHLQKALISLGYSIPHAVTNVYGTETRAAVAAFQRDVGIIGNFGQNFGPKTRLLMNIKMNPDALFGGSIATFLASLFSGA